MIRIVNRSSAEGAQTKNLFYVTNVTNYPILLRGYLDIKNPMLMNRESPNLSLMVQAQLETKENSVNFTFYVQRFYLKEAAFELFILG